MNNSNIYNEKEAIEGIARGINAVSDIVKLTLGAKGKNIIIERSEFPFHIVTNDGISIADACFFTDPLEQRGADFIKEVNKLTDKGSGDGRTTTTVLMQAIINEALAQNVSGIEIRNSLQELIPVINGLIDEQKKEITIDDIASIATVAGESAEMGEIIQEIYSTIGKDGIIELDNSKTDATYYEIKEGVKFENASLVSSSLFNDGNKAVYSKPAVLVTKQRISTTSDIEPLLQKLLDAGKTQVVIFCDDMDNNIASALIATHMSGQFNFAIIKAPTLWKDMVFEDFAKVTGATLVSDATGVNFKNIELKHLGTCDKITTDKHETTILGIADISEHLKYLAEQGDDDSLRRIAWLNTKAAILRVGAGSESDLSYLRRKTADAIHASRLALQDGVVAGGGVALYDASRMLWSKQAIHVNESGDAQPEKNNVGIKILCEALKKPFLQICENAGFDPQGYRVGIGTGFDAKKMEIVEMFEARIVDPALVVKNAVKNAVNVSSILLTSGGYIRRKPKSEDEKVAEMMKSMRPF